MFSNVFLNVASLALKILGFSQNKETDLEYKKVTADTEAGYLSGYGSADVAKIKKIHTFSEAPRKLEVLSKKRSNLLVDCERCRIDTIAILCSEYKWFTYILHSPSNSDYTHEYQHLLLESYLERINTFVYYY